MTQERFHFLCPKCQVPAKINFSQGIGYLTIRCPCGWEGKGLVTPLVPDTALAPARTKVTELW